MNVTPAAMGAKPPPPRQDPIPPLDLGPIIDTLPAAPVTADHRRGVPIYGIQYIRREAVRLAIESYADEDRPADETLIATANLIAEFIRSGKTTEGH